MAKRWTGRRLIGAAVVLVIVGAVGGTAAMRIVKKVGDGPGGKNAPASGRARILARPI